MPKDVDAAPPPADGAARDEPADVGMETQQAPAARPPTRKPSRPYSRPLLNQKRRRRCDCGTAEACFACRRCMEQHCTCGAAGRSTVTALCRESRACNCRVVADGSSRCVLCMGCRQPSVNQSHCRCTPHQEALRRLATDEKKLMDADQAPCHCFDRVAVDPEQHQRRRKRLALIGRRAGVPSSQGLYAKKVRGAIGDFGESDLESDGDCDDVVREMFPVARSSVEELEDTLTVARILDSKPKTDSRAPQQPLAWSGGKPFQASITHTSETINVYSRLAAKAERDEITRRTMPLQLDRALENALFMQDHERAMPSEEMVDYLIQASSVKASRMPELIGSLDNTAATAVGIVVEEYVRQLVIRSDRQSLCRTTKEAVRDFTLMALRDFNYQLFLQQLNLPPLPQLTAEESADVREQLVQLVFTEFLATQRPVDRGGLMAPAQKTPLCEGIREVVSAEIAAALETITAGQASSSLLEHPDEQQTLRAVKVTQRTSKLTGQRIYKIDVGATIGDKHTAKVVLDGFESRQDAERSVVGIRKAMEKQNKRIANIEHPSPARQTDDPIVAELYQQLLNQVKQTRTLQQGGDSAAASSAEKSSGRPTGSKATGAADSPVPERASSRPRSRRTARQPSSSSTASL